MKSHDKSTFQDGVAGIALELYEIISYLQRPRLRDPGWAMAARARCQELSKRAMKVRQAITNRHKTAPPSLDALAGHLDDYASELNKKTTAIRLKEIYQPLSQSYERLRIELKNVRPPRLKGINYPRNLFHFAMGAGGVALYEWVLTYSQTMTILVTLAVVAVTIETGRMVSPRLNRLMMDHVFRRISRPWERHHFNSATFYILGLTLVVFFAPKQAAELAAVVLAVGDPAATIAGKLWGTKKLWRQKSYVGTGAFIATSAVASFMFLLFRAQQLAVVSRLSLALAVALAGAAAEIFSERIDDNLTIPVICAAVAWFWL